MTFEDNLYPPVIERNMYGESGRVSNDDYHWDAALYVREDIVDEIVKFHLLLQWFCNGDVDYWVDTMRDLQADLRYDHDKELVQVERDSYSDGHEEGYKRGYAEGEAEGHKQGYDEALKERSDD